MPRVGSEQVHEIAEAFEAGAPVSELRDTYNLGNRALLNRLTLAREEDFLSDEALDRILVDRTINDFPGNPENRLEAVLSCMNTELKQATTLMLDRNPKRRSGIRNRLSELTDVNLPARPVFEGYCKQTLCPIGFLAQERLGEGLGLATSYFSISDAGEQYGQPIAAFSLMYAVDHNTSLYEFLGPTTSPGDSRSPYNRARIIELVADGYYSMVGLGNELGLNSNGIRFHLKTLQEFGLLTFESLNPEQNGIKPYKWAEGKRPEDAEMIKGCKTLTKRVARRLYENQEGDCNSIAQELGYKWPVHVSVILAGLERQGLAETQFISHQRSEIQLNESSEVLADYTRAVRAALNGKDELQEMETVLEEFREDRELFSLYLDAGIELYSAVSPNINARTPEERTGELLDFIGRYQAEHDRGPRPSEMMDSLNWSYGTVGKYTRQLLGQGMLTRTDCDGKAVRYSLRE